MKSVIMEYFLRSAAVGVLLAMTLRAGADDFTRAEQQQISIPTPGLFARSDAFTVDFTSMRNADFCYPLPVGKSKVKDGRRLEIASSKGDAVKAMFAGQVRLSRHVTGYGNVIVIRHDNGFETVYSHNAQNLVKVGQRVKAGQTIAIIGGSMGRTYCNVEIMVNGGCVNPNTILDVNRHALRRQALLCMNRNGYVDITVIGEDIKKKLMDISNVGKNPFENSNQYKIDLANLDPKEWSYPLPDSKVISPYGGRRRHSGVDIKTRPNDKILAAFDGEVTMSKPYFGYGNCIVIKHANGFETLYSHQSKNLVKVGDKVKAGQVIGLTGRTGRATTEHLHFEVRFMGKRFDPAIIFDHLNHSLHQHMVVFTKSGRSISIKKEKKMMAQGKR